MKITKSYLKQLILEEISNLEEAPSAPPAKTVTQQDVQSLAKRIELMSKAKQADVDLVTKFTNSLLKNKTAEAESLLKQINDFINMNINTTEQDRQEEKKVASALKVVFGNLGSQIQATISAMKSGKVAASATGAGMKSVSAPPPAGQKWSSGSSRPAMPPPPPRK